MQGNPSQRSGDERQEERTQRAVLSLLLHEFPERVTRERLRREGLGDPNALERAIEELANAGLLRREGDVVTPTRAARAFERLELS